VSPAATTELHAIPGPQQTFSLNALSNGRAMNLPHPGLRDTDLAMIYERAGDRVATGYERITFATRGESVLLFDG
jgi:hypothetical protein